VPHIPQLRLSVWMSRQAPAQSVKPVAQERLQVPPEHTWPEGQVRPQPPQLALSVLRSRHVPEQLESPEPHDTLHVPPEQS
jgi:hypothetical protein